MEAMAKKQLAELNRLGNSIKMQIPKELRMMSVKDFLSKGGDLDSLELKELSGISFKYTKKKHKSSRPRKDLNKVRAQLDRLIWA